MKNFLILVETTHSPAKSVVGANNDFDNLLLQVCWQRGPKKMKIPKEASIIQSKKRS